MDELNQHLLALSNIKEEAVIIAGLMALFAAYLVRMALDSRIIASICLPLLLYGALLSIHLTTMHGILLTSDREAQAAIAAGIGLAATVIVILVGMRVFNDIWGVHVRNQNAHLSRSGSGRTA